MLVSCGSLTSFHIGFHSAVLMTVVVPSSFPARVLMKISLLPWSLGARAARTKIFQVCFDTQNEKDKDTVD